MYSLYIIKNLDYKAYLTFQKDKSKIIINWLINIFYLSQSQGLLSLNFRLLNLDIFYINTWEVKYQCEVSSRTSMTLYKVRTILFNQFMVLKWFIYLLILKNYISRVFYYLK